MGITTNVFFFGLWLRIHCFDCLTQFRILFRFVSELALEKLPARPKTHSHEDGFGDDTAANSETRIRSNRILNFDNGFPRLFARHLVIRRANMMIHSCKPASKRRENESRAITTLHKHSRLDDSLKSPSRQHFSLEIHFNMH